MRRRVARADQYSLGVITHLLLSGRMPWRHADLNAAASPASPPPISSVDRPFPDEVDDVVRRALAAEPADRWPSVTAYVEELERSLGELGCSDDAGTAGVAGGRPRADPARRRGRHRCRSTAGSTTRGRPAGAAGSLTTLAVSLLALAVGAAAGWFGYEALDDHVTVTDERDVLSVTVPDEWDASVAGDPWVPPDAEDTFPALSAGTSGDWAESDEGQGVFAGIMPGDDLPDRLPGHPACEAAEEPIDDTIDGDRALTIVAHRLPGRHRRASGAGGRQPAAVGAGPQRRPGDRDRRPGVGGDQRPLSRIRVRWARLVKRAAIDA